jgi:hypothetical protein
MNLLNKLNHYDIIKLDEHEVRLLISADQLKRTKERKAAQVKYGSGRAGRGKKGKVQVVQGEDG